MFIFILEVQNASVREKSSLVYYLVRFCINIGVVARPRYF